jgi:hypothetical protein
MDPPADVIIWMIAFSLASFICGIVAVRALFLPWRESTIIFVDMLIGAITGQIANIWLGIRLRKRLTQSRRELAEEPGQKTIEDGASKLVEENIASVVEPTTKKLEPVLRDEALRSIGSRGRQTG